MANKKRQLGNRADDYMQEDKPETFGEREYDDDVFAELDKQGIPVTSDKIPIMDIDADTLQPRRIAPEAIREDEKWDGDAGKMPELLQAWAELLYDTGNDIPIVKILKGEEEPSQYMTGEGFVDNFIKLLGIAYSIRSIGLNQPIGVRPLPRGKYRIIFGERRWTAFHILNHFLPAEDFSQIPVKIVDVSEWQIRAIQVSENNSREDTNAISKAREFALLIITARSDTDTYDPPHALNPPGCDRPWYAQVANGDVHRIPRGMGSDFEQILGISTGQMRKYRNLLKLTGDYAVDNTIWNIADEHDWAEKFMYEINHYLDIETIKEVLYRSPANGIGFEEAFREAIESAKNGAKLAEKQAQREASPTPQPAGQGDSITTPPETSVATKSTDEPYLNRYVELHSGYVGQVIEQRGTWIRLQHPHTDETIEASTHLIIDTDVTPPTEETVQVEFSQGDRVRTRTGHTGQVVSIDGNVILVSFGNYSTNHKPEDLTIVYQDDTTDTPSAQASDEDTGADNADSLSFQEKRANAWVNKPATYDGQPVFVIQTKKGMPGYLVVQSGNDRYTVPVDALKPPAPYADDKQLPISSLASLPTKSELLIAPKERPFIHDIALLCASEGLSFKHITAIHELRKDDVDPEELPLQLERAYVEIEKLANHLKDKGKMLFTDIAQAYSEATDDD